MAEIIRMPKMSDTMEEGVIASWLVKVGDNVNSGDILAEVETDKATMELESYENGTILHLGVKEKESVKIDGVIAIIGEKGENINDLLKSIETPEDTAPKENSEPVATESTHTKEIDTSNINAVLITMPKMSDTMTEGVIANWLKKVGDEIKSGDILAEIETDKATMELEAYDDGTLLHIGADAGSSVPIDGVIAVIGEKGADYHTLIEAHSMGSQTIQEVKSQEAETTQKVAEKLTVTPTATNGKVKASPLAKRLAKELGYDISKIAGSGEGGRIIKRDVESYSPIESTPAVGASSTQKEVTPIQLPAVVGQESHEDVTLSQMRKTIARRLSESKFTAPHFYLTMEINMDKAIEARNSMNEISPVKISFNDLVLKSTAAALRMHPKVNVSWQDDTLRYNKHIHIGVAVAVEEGLLVPVIRFADNKSLSHISAEVKELAAKATNKQLQPADWEGNTFTISNLGMFGIEEFTAIINPPDACILAIGGIKQTPIVKDGQVVPGNVMKVTLSCDHRAVDGAVGAAFLKTLKGLLEDPVRILL